MPEATLTLNPAVVRWSLEDRGWDPAELAEKSGVPESVIRRIQSERSPVEIRHLEMISECMKHPLAAFFLPEPPNDPELINYGRVRGQEPKRLSRRTLDAIRKSRYWQSISRDILEEQSESLKPGTKKYSPESDPEGAALGEMERLGFGPGGIMFKKKSLKESYNALRENIESLNIFVHQLDMDPGEARGISLTGDLPAVIAVSPSGSYGQRIFSLLHEYAHVLLRTNGYCMSDPDPQNYADDESRRVESWCNAFAGSVLMPEREFLELVRMLEKKSKDPRYVIKKISAIFGASEQAIVARMMGANPGSPLSESYGKLRKYIKDRGVSKPKEMADPAPYDMCLAERGKRFVSMVFISHARGTITYADIIEYLELDPEYFPKLRQTLCRDPKYADDWSEYSEHFVKLWNLKE